MRITIDLPEDLFIAAQKAAAERGIDISALTESGLRYVLGDSRIQWVTVEGTVPDGLDIADREKMTAWGRSESD